MSEDEQILLNLIQNKLILKWDSEALLRSYCWFDSFVMTAEINVFVSTAEEEADGFNKRTRSALWLCGEK